MELLSSFPMLKGWWTKLLGKTLLSYMYHMFDGLKFEVTIPLKMYQNNLTNFVVERGF